MLLHEKVCNVIQRNKKQASLAIQNCRTKKYKINIKITKQKYIKKYINKKMHKIN